LTTEGKTMRVLVAIDGSAPAGLAVELATNIGWPAGSEILVAEAIESETALFGGPLPALAVDHADRIEGEMRAAAQRTVDEACRHVARPEISVNGVVLSGRPATAIVDRARGMFADLIVLGSRGHGTIESMLLGSVSAEVVDHAPAPVLVARSPRFERVVLAWDGSSCASRAAELLRSWPIFARSQVRVVSVADIEPVWWTGFPTPGAAEASAMYLDTAEATRLHYDKMAREMADRLRFAGLAADAERRDGDAATELISAAAACNADLIVMGTHGRTGLARLVIGSVARNVVHHASCSVLIVREGRG
jgi:nucleotide-binding universal stress UspA family protein